PLPGALTFIARLTRRAPRRNREGPYRPDAFRRRGRARRCPVRRAHRRSPLSGSAVCRNRRRAPPAGAGPSLHLPQLDPRHRPSRTSTGTTPDRDGPHGRGAESAHESGRDTALPRTGCRLHDLAHRAHRPGLAGADDAARPAPRRERPRRRKGCGSRDLHGDRAHAGSRPATPVDGSARDGALRRGRSRNAYRHPARACGDWRRGPAVAPSDARRGLLMAKICVIRQGVYPYDARLTREIKALLAAGHEVDLICLQWGDEPPREERAERLRVYRLPIRKRHGGKLRYLFEYAAFFIASALLVAALHLRHRYDVVQVNTLPDSLVFAAAIPRLLGARVLLDLHECMPEFFALKYGLSPAHRAIKLLAWWEQASIRFADAAVTCREPMRERFLERAAAPEETGVVLNSFDDERFNLRRRSGAQRADGNFVLVCHGTIDYMYGLDLV